MKRVFVAFVMVAAVAVSSFAQHHHAGTGAKSAAGSAGVEEQIKKLEQGWAEAMQKADAAAIPTYEAEDIVSTDPAGQVTTRDQDIQSLKSGDFKVQSLQYPEMKVSVYGNAAVATGLANMKASYKGQDMSGSYRFTDTWVNRGGKWQCVATQVTKVVPQ